ncbi:MAG: nucleotidyl transferase AbiEii/AbiGii toxin family protein [Ferruginibacter sp.]|nr:nucleotidyl transferase AbiEii/AbiGii toxin family protein [Ferruginibacter sp.]
MLHLTTVENDTYCILQKLNTIPFIRNNFALAGGTSLALQIGHRTSIDLDFFCTNPFDLNELEIVLSSEKDLLLEFIGKNSRMFFCYINKVKCDFVQEPATLLNPFIEIDKVLYFSVEDIAAMKMHTICGRGKRKDFFDVYALLEMYSWKKLIKLFEKKYNKSQLNILWRSISYFEDAENDFEIIGFKPFNKNWEEIKKILLLKCN